MTYEIYCKLCQKEVECEVLDESERVKPNESVTIDETGVKRKREVINADKVDVKVKGRTDYKVKYVGETKKTAYERGKEHLDDLKNLREGSHLLKHLLEVHPNLALDELEVGMRVRKSFKSAFERPYRFTRTN